MCIEKKFTMESDHKPLEMIQQKQIDPISVKPIENVVTKTTK